MRVLLIAYDNGDHIHRFPMGLGYIARVLDRMGIDIEIWQQDINHYPDESLDVSGYDVVCIGIVGGYYQYRKLLSLSKYIKNTFFIIGGHGPSPEPEFFLKKTGADICVMGEGEETVRELFERIGNHESFSDVRGIAYRIGEDVYVNPRRETIKDVDSIEMPLYERFPMEHYRLFQRPRSKNTDFSCTMLSGRGCPFRCNFCYRMDQGFRPRSVDSIVEEALYLKAEYGITRIGFDDELLMSSVKRTEELCRAFQKHFHGIEWDCNGRLNYAKPDLLKLMKESGCVFINYGIECYDNQILKNMNKHLTTKQIKTGVEATLAVGISPGFNMIFGNIGENEKTLNKSVNFLLKYDDGAQRRTIRPVTPYPGCDLYYKAIEDGLLNDVEDFYENKHINSDLVAVNFTEMTDDQFHDALLQSNTRLLKNYYKKQKNRALAQTEKLYRGHDTSFRGFR